MNYEEDKYPEPCAHPDQPAWTCDEAGWQSLVDGSPSSVWIEVWSTECPECGRVWESVVHEIRIEVPPDEYLERDAA